MVRTTAAPRPSAALSLLAGAAGLAVVAVLADPAGRLLAVPAALVLVAVALRDVLLRPVLAAGPEGITVVVGLRRRSVAWHSVGRVRVITDRRTPLLELDLGDTLVVLARGRLGRPPQDVLAELQEIAGDRLRGGAP